MYCLTLSFEIPLTASQMSLESLRNNEEPLSDILLARRVSIIPSDKGLPSELQYSEQESFPETK